MKLKCLHTCIITNAISMVINVVSSKIDQYREGSSLVVARMVTINSLVCTMESLFLVWVSLHKRVFRGISKTKLGDKLRKGGGLSYSQTRKLLLG